MEIAELILKYLEVLVWPFVTIFIIFLFRKELVKYSKKLTKKREIIVFNKIDMVSDQEINKKIDIFAKKIKKKIYPISALKHKSMCLTNEKISEITKGNMQYKNIFSQLGIFLIQ